VPANWAASGICTKPFSTGLPFLITNPILPHDDFRRAHHDYRICHYDFRPPFVPRMPAIRIGPAVFGNYTSGSSEEGDNAA